MFVYDKYLRNIIQIYGKFLTFDFIDLLKNMNILGLKSK